MDAERGEEGRWPASLGKLCVYVLRTQAKDGKTIVLKTNKFWRGLKSTHRCDQWISKHMDSGLCTSNVSNTSKYTFIKSTGGVVVLCSNATFTL